MFKSAISHLFEDDCVKIISISGLKSRPNYKPKYLDNGAYELVEDGFIHSYEEIQAWKATTDMSAIMERYIRTGDSSILNQRACFYGDVTALPKNYVELANTLREADNFFNALPIELKKEYDMNPAVFYANVNDVVGVVSEHFGKVNNASNIGVTPTPTHQPDGGSIQVPSVDFPVIEKGSEL